MSRITCDYCNNKVFRYINGIKYCRLHLANLCKFCNSFPKIKQLDRCKYCLDFSNKKCPSCSKNISKWLSSIRNLCYRPYLCYKCYREYSGGLKCQICDKCHQEKIPFIVNHCGQNICYSCFSSFRLHVCYGCHNIDPLEMIPQTLVGTLNGWNYCNKCSLKINAEGIFRYQSFNIKHQLIRDIRRDLFFGIELEGAFRRPLIEKIDNIYKHNWIIKSDHSVRAKTPWLSLEFCSPILAYPDHLDNVSNYIKVLQESFRKIFPTKTSGMHLHLSHTYPQFYTKFCYWWINNEEEIYEKFPVIKNRYEFCKKFDGYTRQLFKGVSWNNISRQQIQWPNLGDDRYTGLNLSSFARHNTFEIRIFNGTFNTNVITERIKYFCDKSLELINVDNPNKVKV